MLTYFISFRSQTVGGAVQNPRLMVFDDSTPTKKPALKTVDWPEATALVAGRRLVFAAHGFNVSQAEGVRALARMNRHIGLPSPYLFIGVLWPGDFWLPVINYPTESADANDCGARLAACCAAHFSDAAEYSFFSHSLGARVILAAVARLHKPAKLLCLTAGAVDNDCLLNEFAAARDNAEAIQVLASKKDLVLRFAYPAGDFVGDILDSDDEFFRRALGRKGPYKPSESHVSAPWQIAEKPAYGHGDYMPSSENSDFGNTVEPKPLEVAAYLKRAIDGLPQTWPP